MLPKYCIILAIFFKYGIYGHGRNIYGTITGNQTLTHAKGPYRVTSDLVVAENATLAIESGTQVNFLPSVGIRVHGSLNAKGTPSHRITFRAVPCKNAPSCKNSAIPYNKGIRLVGGTSYDNGRLELQWMRKWGTVCGQYLWDMRDTRVACRQLGFLGAKRYYFHPGRGRAYMKSVRCTGYEESLWRCRYSWTYHNPCGECFVVIRIQNHEFQTAVYSSLALFEIYKLHIVSVSEK